MITEKLNSLDSDYVSKPAPDDTFQMKWEHGQPDFMGVHSFNNILGKLQTTIGICSVPQQDSIIVSGENCYPQVNHRNQNCHVSNDEKKHNTENTPGFLDASSFDFVLQRIAHSMGEEVKLDVNVEQVKDDQGMIETEFQRESDKNKVMPQTSPIDVKEDEPHQKSNGKVRSRTKRVSRARKSKLIFSRETPLMKHLQKKLFACFQILLQHLF